MWKPWNRILFFNDYDQKHLFLITLITLSCQISSDFDRLGWARIRGRGFIYFLLLGEYDSLFIKEPRANIVSQWEARKRHYSRPVDGFFFRFSFSLNWDVFQARTFKWLKVISRQQQRRPNTRQPRTFKAKPSKTQNAFCWHFDVAVLGAFTGYSCPSR